LRAPASTELAVKQIVDRFSRIDALISVAGAAPQTDLFAMTDAEWIDGLSLKFHGARCLTINAWEALKSARGAVVLTSGATALARKAVGGRRNRQCRDCSTLGEGLRQ
jgi:3-oxoacyl-[acyl-carrier protein] reductase